MSSPDSNFEPAAWDAFVLAHPQGTFFQLSGWAEVARDTFGHPFHAITVRDGERITGVLPLVEIRSRLFGHRLIANGFCVGGGPLWITEAARRALFQAAEERARSLKAAYIELRDTPSAPPGWRMRNDLYAGFSRPIAADEADNLKQIPKKQRAVLRKAMAAGLSATIDQRIDTFFALYARNMRNHGTPALPRRFFANLVSAFGAGCEIMTVRRGGEALGSVLSFYFRDSVLPYYTGSMDDARTSGANDYMYWSVMRRARARGYTIFDFGRSKIGTGPYHFKRNWGLEPRPIAHQYYMCNGGALPNINPTNPRYALLIRAWRHLPIPLANAVSPALSRSLG